MTFELKLKPAAFKLPAVTLPDALTTVATTLVVLTLPPIIFPVPLTIPEPNNILPAVTFPDTETTEPV